MSCQSSKIVGITVMVQSSVAVITHRRLSSCVDNVKDSSHAATRLRRLPPSGFKKHVEHTLSASLCNIVMCIYMSSKSYA